MSKDNIRPITMEHIQRYGDIYAKAFSGEPWNDPWKPEDAVIHVRELLESKQAYGPSCVFFAINVAGYRPFWTAIAGIIFTHRWSPFSSNQVRLCGFQSLDVFAH